MRGSLFSDIRYDDYGIRRREVRHINHVSTQLPYAITVAAISFVTYVIAGFTQNAVLLLAIGIALTLGTLFIMKAIYNKKNIDNE